MTARLSLRDGSNARNVRATTRVRRRNDGRWRTQGGSGSTLFRGDTCPHGSGECLDRRFPAVKVGVTGRRGGGLNRRRFFYLRAVTSICFSLRSSNVDQPLLLAASIALPTASPRGLPQSDSLEC